MAQEVAFGQFLPRQVDGHAQQFLRRPVDGDGGLLTRPEIGQRGITGLAVGILREDAVVLVDDVEQSFLTRQPFGGAEEEITLRVQRKMKPGDDQALKIGRQIDHQVAARDQVEPGKRRILHQVVRGEDAGLAQVGADAILPVLEREEPVPPGLRQVLDGGGGVDAVACGDQGGGVDVGAEDLKAAAVAAAVHLLEKQDREAVDLLAGGTARHPDPHA